MSLSATARLERLQDEDLIRIALGDERDGYEDDYVTQARTEMAKRGLDSSTIENLKAEVVAERMIDDANAEVPLSVLGHFGFFIFGANPIAWLIAYNLGARGFERKSKQAFVMIGVGMVLVILRILLLFVPT
jgi:hypothetical protein